MAILEVMLPVAEFIKFSTKNKLDVPQNNRTIKIRINLFIVRVVRSDACLRTKTWVYHESPLPITNTKKLGF